MIVIVVKETLQDGWETTFPTHKGGRGYRWGRSMAVIFPKMPMKEKSKMKVPDTRPASRKLISMAPGLAKNALSVSTGSKKG